MHSLRVGKVVSTAAAAGLLGITVLALLVAVSPRVSAYTLHAPILIDGNANFTVANGVTGGTGSLSDPYVIGGWEVNASTAVGIQVRNTNASFVIRNSYVHSGSWSEGILMWNVTNASVEDTLLSGNEVGVELGQASNVRLARLNVTGNGWGISVFWGKNVTVIDCNVTWNSAIGIVVYYSSDTTLSMNNASRNPYGIAFAESAGANVSDNDLTGNELGLVASNADSLLVARNRVSGNKDGMRLADSTNLTLTGNLFTSSGIVIEGQLPEYFDSHAVSSDNLVNGKPVRYYSRCRGVGIDGVPVGQLILASCSGVQVANLDIANTDIGLQMDFVNDSVVTRSRFADSDAGAVVRNSGNLTFSEDVVSSNAQYGLRIVHSRGISIVGGNVSQNPIDGIYVESSSGTAVAQSNVSLNARSGIVIMSSSGTTVAGNNVSGSLYGIRVDRSTATNVTGNLLSVNEHGVYLTDASETTVSGNNVSGSTYGIDLVWAKDTRVLRNVVVDNNFGISLQSSRRGYIVSNNVSGGVYAVYLITSYYFRLFHNSFMNFHALDDGGLNRWNASYPTGGNYWSNYGGVDEFSGPSQNVPGPDGIGDTRHSYDRYPLMAPRFVPNESPSAWFALSPAAGGVATVFTASASGSWDAEDPTASLEIRWDWEDDGLWDTAWSPAKEAQHQYPIPGVYRVRLEVRDTKGLTDETTRSVTVLPWAPYPPGGLALSRPTFDDIRLDWRAVPGATAYRVYESGDRFAPFPSGWSPLVTTPLLSFVAAGNATDNLTHFYLVRAVNGTEEGPNSTMGVKMDLSFAFNPAQTNVVWFSIPYVSVYRRASEIANELGIANIDVVGKWDPAAQRSIVYYYARGGWRGTDFAIAPGDGLYLGIRMSFNWTLYGTDDYALLSFAPNPSPSGNVNWIGLPLTGAYVRASSIAAVLTASKVTEIGLWDPTAQTVLRWYWTGAAWAGTDFLVEPGRGFYLVVASRFLWTPWLVTPTLP